MSKLKKMSIFVSIIFLTMIISGTTALGSTPEIIVDGPKFVAIDKNVQLSATTSSGIDEKYTWYTTFAPSATTTYFKIENATTYQSFLIGKTCHIKGLKPGPGHVVIQGLKSGVTKKYEFYTSSDKEVTLFLEGNFIHNISHQTEYRLDCDIKATPPQGSQLYLALEANGQFWYLKSDKVTKKPSPFLMNPRSKKYELYQFPIKQGSTKFTFYAAILNKEAEFISNIDSTYFLGQIGTSK